MTASTTSNSVSVNAERNHHARGIVGDSVKGPWRIRGNNAGFRVGGIAVRPDPKQSTIPEVRMGVHAGRGFRFRHIGEGAE